MGARLVLEESLLTLLDDNQLEDFLCDKYKGSMKDPSSKDEVLELEGEYNGERELVSQTPSMDDSSRGVFFKVINKVNNNHPLSS